MAATSCEEPFFQWNDVEHACAGCVENETLHDNCKICDDYVENVELRQFLEPLDNH